MNLWKEFRNKCKTSIGYDVIWTFTGQIGVMIVLLIVNKLLSNQLSIEDFGSYNIIKRSTAVLSFILLGGLGISIPRYLSVFIAKKQSRNTQSTLFASWFYLFSVALFTTVVYIFLYKNLSIIVIGEYNWSFYIACLLYAMSLSLISYIAAYYRGIGKFKEFNISQIIFQCIMLLPLIMGIDRLSTIIISWTVLNTLGISYFFMREYSIYKEIVYHFTPSFSLFRTRFTELSIYSLPRLCGDFFLFAYSAFPVIYIGNKLGLQVASYYSVGISLLTIVTPLFAFLGVILLPLVSKQIACNNSIKARRSVRQLTIIYLIFSVLFSAIMYLAIKYLIVVFFAEKYLPAMPFAKIITMSLVPQSMYLLYRNPNDAISTIPFNTIILAICFGFLVVGYVVYNDIIHYAYIYLLVSILQCILSVGVWELLINRKIRLEANS